MTFADPAILWALFALPVLIGVYLLAQRRRSRYAVRFTNLDLLASVVTRAPRWRRHVPAVLYLLAFAALLIGLARPQTVVAVPKQQATVVLVLDVSGSMNARDVRPTRLVAAAEAARTFVGELPVSFKVGVVAFSNTVETLATPTIDRDAVDVAIGLLRASGGTAMGDGIERGLTEARPPKPGAPAPAPGTSGDATPSDPSPPRADGPPAVVVLLSDGFNTAGSVQPLDAAADAKDLRVPIYTVALGTDAGTVDVPDSSTGLIRTVPVPPDNETLRQVADATGAKFFAAPSKNELKSIYRSLGSKIGFVNEHREITVAFVALALALLLAAGAASLLWFNRLP